ncbi:TPA: hypothetical protein DCE37_22670 [Candidatus Latescibacteria bacterium]|nr:hypothetical protein [Candidatus Latescibacterota bacterium]|tara:strand:+ start:203 stop:778 length:576 start_codon:yes stop_codon:yes gene_type:complete
MGADRDAFFERADGIHRLFPTLFEGIADPVEKSYQNLSTLAGGKHVRTAVSNDGRLYGPAIFRIYKSEEGHKPHYDSVRRRTKSSYEVARFEHQFAAVLCIKQGSAEGDSILYRAKAEEEVEKAVTSGEFHRYADTEEIPSARFELDAGDLYFFYTENVHEVPRVNQTDTRVVLAVFIATSPDREEIFVWS